MKRILSLVVTAAFSAAAHGQLAMTPADEAPLAGPTLSLRGSITVFSSEGPMRGPTLALDSLADSDRCVADFNRDGFVDFFDYDLFVACFESQACPPSTTGDVNEDGFVDGFDYLDYVARFEAGC